MPSRSFDFEIFRVRDLPSPRSSESPESPESPEADSNRPNLDIQAKSSKQNASKEKKGPQKVPKANHPMAEKVSLSVELGQVTKLMSFTGHVHRARTSTTGCSRGLAAFVLPKFGWYNSLGSVSLRDSLRLPVPSQIHVFHRQIGETTRCFEHRSAPTPARFCPGV
eukprot:scaffold245_cov256-Pinguiococcus_pyrenoidosus.AAC.32